MKNEFITTSPTNWDDWTCICGNTTEGAGFFNCDNNGKPWVSTHEVGMTKSYACAQCGRLIYYDLLSVFARKKPINLNGQKTSAQPMIYLSVPWGNTYR